LRLKNHKWLTCQSAALETTIFRLFSSNFLNLEPVQMIEMYNDSIHFPEQFSQPFINIWRNQPSTSVMIYCVEAPHVLCVVCNDACQKPLSALPSCSLWYSSWASSALHRTHKDHPFLCNKNEYIQIWSGIFVLNPSGLPLLLEIILPVNALHLSHFFSQIYTYAKPLCINVQSCSTQYRC
jgi:hypothetical protein